MEQIVHYIENNPVTVGQDGILRPVGNRPLAAEPRDPKSADAIGAQDGVLGMSSSLEVNVFYPT